MKRKKWSTSQIIMTIFTFILLLSMILSYVLMYR